MIRYAINFSGDMRLREKLGLLRPVLVSTLQSWATATAAYCIANKLSGSPLNRRTGRLSRTVHGESEAAGNLVSGVVAAGEDVPYARPLEFGAKAHVVVATRAQALRIPLPDGNFIFRKSANIPALPAFEYMRGSLRERAPDGIAQLKAATMGVLS